MIMPFSATAQCTEDEWTAIFEELIKPAVEGDSELGYECRRSTATRGNLVRVILEDLQDAYVVIADLTDRNANVFYELGVRHTLTDRTILIAQNRDDIPFDLSNYANHVYGWRTEEERTEFEQTIRGLLRDVDVKPNRPDNPVSDFLRASSPRATSGSETGLPDRLRFLEEQVLVLGQQLSELIGSPKTETRPRDVLTTWLSQASGLQDLPSEYRPRDVAQLLAASGNRTLARSFLRSLGRSVVTDLEEAIGPLNRREGGQVDRREISGRASTFIEAVMPVYAPLEEFALACVEAGYGEGVRGCIDIAGQLITLQEKLPGGLRFAVGLPGYLAWRLLLLMGAKAVYDEAYDLAGLLINTPIEVHLLGGQVSHEPLWAQRKLFYPEALLGFADLGIKSIGEAWSESPHLHDFFASEQDFENALATFLVLVALRHADEAEQRGQFYPGYRLVTRDQSALKTFASRLQNVPGYVATVAGALGESAEEFAEKWGPRARRLNEAKLGGQYWAWDEPDLPEAL